MSFLDMISVSLSAAFSPAHITERRAYATAVLAREDAIVDAQGRPGKVRRAYGDVGEDVGVSEGNVREEGGGTEEAQGGEEEGGRRGVSEGNVREEGGGMEEAEGGEEEGGRRGARMGPVLPPLEMLEKMRRRRRRRRHPRMW